MAGVSPVAGGDSTPSSAPAVLNCAAAAAKGCGGSCCGCVCNGCGLRSANGLAGCSAAACKGAGGPALGPASGRCHGRPTPKLLAVLRTTGEAVGALLLSSQLELLLPGMRLDEAWLRAMGTTVLLPLGVAWLIEDARLRGPSLPALQEGACAAVTTCCSGWLVSQPYAFHSAHHTRDTRTTAAVQHQADSK